MPESSPTAWTVVKDGAIEVVAKEKHKDGSTPILHVAWLEGRWVIRTNDPVLVRAGE